MMVSLPVLARRLGNDPGIALWLAVLSPLALFSFVSSGHNDALMMGLMLAGITVGTRRAAPVGRRPVRPGRHHQAAGRGRRGVPGGRRVHPGGDRSGRWRVVAESAGHHRAGRGRGDRRGRVRVDVARADGAARPDRAAGADHPAGVGRHVRLRRPARGRPAGDPERHRVSASRPSARVAAVSGILWMVFHTRDRDAVRLCGLALILFVVLSPTLWPWYLMWGVAVLAATSAQRSRALAAWPDWRCCWSGPGGTPMLNGGDYWVTGPLVLVAIIWFVLVGTGRHLVDRSRSMPPEPAPPATWTTGTVGPPTTRPTVAATSGRSSPSTIRPRWSTASTVGPVTGAPHRPPRTRPDRWCTVHRPGGLPGLPGRDRRGRGRRRPVHPQRRPVRSDHLGRCLVPARRSPRLSDPPAHVPRPRGGQTRSPSSRCSRWSCGPSTSPDSTGVAALVLSGVTGATAVLGRRPAGPPARRRRGRAAGGPAVRRVPGDVRLQLRLLRGHRRHLRGLRVARPARPSVVAGRAARGGGHGRLARGPGLRGELRLVRPRRPPGGTGDPGPCSPRCSPRSGSWPTWSICGVHTGQLTAWRLTERGGWKSYPSLAYPFRIVWTFVSGSAVPDDDRADPVRRDGGGRDRRGADDPGAPAGPGAPLRICARSARRRCPSRSGCGPAS